MKKSLSFLVLAGAAAAANAATWAIMPRVIGTGSIGFVDTESIQTKGGRIKFWLYTVNDPTKLDTDKKGETNMDRLEIDCGERSYAIYSTKFYNAQGNIIWQYAPKGMPTFDDITPDSFADRLFKVVCSPNFPKAEPGTKEAPYFRVYGEPKNIAKEWFEKYLK